MRIKFVLPALLALLLAGAAEAFAQTATVVTQSGQHFRGQIVSMGIGEGANSNYGGFDDYSDVVIVRTNGRDRRIPMRDVSMIDFVGNGNASQSEIIRANEAYDGFIVLRNGRTIAARPVDLQPYNNTLVVSDSRGDRTVPLNQVARVYFGTGSDARYGRPGTYDPYYNRNGGAYGQYGSDDPYGYEQPAYRNGRSVTIPTNQAWSNSGIDVRRGEVVHFRANGNVALSQNPGDFGTPAGANDGRLAGNSPLPGVTGGMLIGRVGNSRPFAIGAESDITMPANGRLYLGVNDDYVGDNSGNFVVEMDPR